MSGAARGFLSARVPAPDAAAGAPLDAGPLRLPAGHRALLAVPAGLDRSRPAPLLVLLHGAGGDGEGIAALLAPLAAATGALVIAPKSRAATWDVVADELGFDVETIDAALATVLAAFRVDGRRVAFAGFSDGASYALTLGLANGDLVREVVAFSPGFAVPPSRRGHPRVFVSHGTTDRVLPIGATTRRLVPRLRAEGYAVELLEFEGGHGVPEAVQRAAAAWLGWRPGAATAPAPP